MNTNKCGEIFALYCTFWTAYIYVLYPFESDCSYFCGCKFVCFVKRVADWPCL